MSYQGYHASHIEYIDLFHITSLSIVSRKAANNNEAFPKLLLLGTADLSQTLSFLWMACA